MKKLFTLILISLFALGCQQSNKSGKPVISVSILPQKYFIERIAGDHFEIHVITPPGSSPETYEPVPQQMKTLSQSVLYFANGYLMFEDYLVKKLGDELSAKMVDLSQGIDLIASDIVEHGDHVHIHGVDPHYWLATNEVRIQAETILKTLSAYDPENAETYEANFSEFVKDIDALDTHIRELLAGSKTKVFLIYHPAFGYLAREYGLEQVAIEMDGKEPTASHIKSVVDLVTAEGINMVLIQSQFNMAAAEVVAKEIGGTVEILNPLPEDWLENMYAIAHSFQKALNP
ncbi:MAG: zinc ABC transporter substrate-binding protein [Bacteroidales bacterium]|nr:zinc ABC transporter substrate-binding protein [Bacteroidales bacterium]